MLKVRRILTEILLEVTTEEMEAVAQEVLSKAKAKGTRNFNYDFTFLLAVKNILDNILSDLYCFGIILLWASVLSTHYSQLFTPNRLLHVEIFADVYIGTTSSVLKRLLLKETECWIFIRLCCCNQVYVLLYLWWICLQGCCCVQCCVAVGYLQMLCSGPLGNRINTSSLLL